MKEIFKTKYYNNFTTLVVDDVKYLKIHQNVKYLTFGYSFDQDIKGYIPNSVTHLILDINLIIILKDVFQIV